MINRLLTAGAAAALISSMSVGGISPIANVAASVSSLFGPQSAYSSPTGGGGGIFAALAAGAHHFSGGSDGTDMAGYSTSGYRPPNFNDGRFRH